MSYNPVNPNGQAAMADSSPVVIASDQTPIPVDENNFPTLSSIDGKIIACDTGSVTVASSALPTGAATEAKQPSLGTAGTPSADVITVQGVTSMTPLKVDGSAVTQPVSGTVAVTQGTATNLKTQAEAYQGGSAVGAANPLQVSLANTGANATAVKVDASSVAVPVTDNSSSLSVDWNGTQPVTGSGTATGALRVEIANNGTGTVGLNAGTNAIGKLAANSGVTIGAVELAASQTLGTVTTLTGGAVAHDGADSGNPLKVGSKSVSTQSGQTAVASGDRSDVISDLDGTLIQRMCPHGDLVTGNASATSTSDTSVVAAQGASTYYYITGFEVGNTGSSTTLITFKDGSGGSTLWYAIAPAGGGAIFPQGSKPIFKTSANTALYFACGTASTTVYVSVTGYKSKV